MKFISCDIEHRYVKKLSKHLDIEFSDDFDYIEKSGKALIIWNNYGDLVYEQPKYIKKCELYRRFKKEGKEAYVVERGALPDSIFIDRHGFLLDSDSYNKEKWNKELTIDQLKNVKKYIKGFVSDASSLESQSSSRLSSQEFYEKIGVNPNDYKKIVFVPMQMHNDTVMILWADWVKDLFNFQDTISQIAKEKNDILFIVKNHPNEELRHHMLSSKNVKIVDDLHYKDCISYSDCVVTINSGVGLQAMMWNKPVGIVGKAFYQFDEINTKLNSEKDVLKFINDPKPPLYDCVLKFIHYLKFEYYCTCIMKSLGNNCSEPVEVEKITFEKPDGSIYCLEKEIEKDYSKDVLLELIGVLPNHCLLKKTCLDCLNYCSLEENTKDLYIGTELNEITEKILDISNFKKSDDKTYKKRGITVHFEELPKKTKVMSIYKNPVNVPLPVTPYLRKLYGNDWRKPKKQIISTKENLNIVYTFNNYGWVFEFEANYYKKYSNHNVIPIHQKDLLKYRDKNIDIVVVPSAWHWVRDLKLNDINYINQFKKNGTNFVCQINSHIEEQFLVENADLIMPSSKYIFDALEKKYGYKNMVWFPHFIDTNLFIPKYQWNDYKLGFAGNFKNRYKRPHIVEKLSNDFELLRQCDYHGHLKEGRSHEDMVDFYNNIDIYIAPSLSEGSPYPMLEAMSCGKLVFITDTGIAPYLLNKFFIIPNTTDQEIYDEFKKRINQLMTYSKDRILELGLKNRERVKKLDWSKNVKYLDDFYKFFYNNKLDKCEEIKNIILTNLK